MKIKRRREKLGLTQWRVAKRIGFTRSGYANVENGHRRTSKANLRRIRRVLGEHHA